MANQRFRKLLPLIALSFMFAVSEAGELAPKQAENADGLALDFDFSKIPEPEEKQGKPIVRAVYEYFYATSEEQEQKSGNSNSLVSFVWATLKHHYIEKHQLAATKEEIDQFLKAMGHDTNKPLADPELSKEDAETLEMELRQFAKDHVERWKMDRRLYEQYGGTVVFQQLNPLEPVGAYKAFLKDMEKAKVFEIYNQEDRSRFWSHVERKNLHIVLPEDVDFTRPWWLQLEED